MKIKYIRINFLHLLQGQILSVSACEAVRKTTRKVISRVIGGKKPLVDPFSKFYSRLKQNVSFLPSFLLSFFPSFSPSSFLPSSLFSYHSHKNTLTIIASSTICTEDAHVPNKTAFMFCAEKLHKGYHFIFHYL